MCPIRRMALETLLAVFRKVFKCRGKINAGHGRRTSDGRCRTELQDREVALGQDKTYELRLS